MTVSALGALQPPFATACPAHPLRIAIFGLGYVGLTAAGCLLALGHRVTGVDPDPAKVAAAEAGLPASAEPGLAGLIAAGRRRGHAAFAADIGDALEAADVALVCVGTPGSEEGPHDLTAVSAVVAGLCRALAGRSRAPAVVFRSTLPPGTMDRLVLPPLRAAGVQGEVVYNPEFMRETTSVADFMAPARIVVGTEDGQPSAIIAQLYAGIDAPVFHSDYRTAELSKLVDNAAHALKVAFANEVARIGNGLDADVGRLIEIFLADTKLNISPRYLRPGGAFGGSCLQKDLTALTHLAERHGIAAPVFGATLTSNAAHKRHLLRRLTAGLTPDAGILLVGIGFKPGSGDLRDSANVEIAADLADAGYRLAIHDPAVDLTALSPASLGSLAARLPAIAGRFVSASALGTARFDLVVEAAGSARGLPIGGARIVALDSLA